MTNDELQLLREFRAGIPAPDEATRRRIYAQATRGRARARRSWWRLPSVVVAAGVATAAVAVLLISPWSGSDGGLVQRALAAIGDGPVVHLVTEYAPSTVYVNLKTGRESAGTLRTETWFDRENDRYRSIETQGGRLLDDQLGTYRNRRGNQVTAATHFFVALATGLKSSSAKLVGRGTFDGRPIYWLRLGFSEVGVDAHTYKPILFRSRSGKRYLYERILVAKAIGYDPSDFERRGPKQMPAFPGQLAAGYAFGSTDRAANGTVVRAPWLTAGTAVAGLRLRAVTPFTIRKTKHRFSYGAPRPEAIHGLALVYGSPSLAVATALPTPVNVYGRPRDALAATRFTTVYELPHAPRTPPWFGVPAGSVEIQSGYTTVGSHVVRTPWIGYLSREGRDITISTPLGPHALLRIAHGLHVGRSGSA
jgi:hypothetical protein